MNVLPKAFFSEIVKSSMTSRYCNLATELGARAPALELDADHIDQIDEALPERMSANTLLRSINNYIL